MSVRILKQLVCEYQRERFGPPEAAVAHREVVEMLEATGLQSERYWLLWALCALMNQEPFCREWKKRKPTREERRKKIAARAKALSLAMKQREELKQCSASKKK